MMNELNDSLKLQMQRLLAQASLHFENATEKFTVTEKDSVRTRSKD